MYCKKLLTTYDHQPQCVGVGMVSISDSVSVSRRAKSNPGRSRASRAPRARPNLARGSNPRARRTNTRKLLEHVFPVVAGSDMNSHARRGVFARTFSQAIPSEIAFSHEL